MRVVKNTGATILGILQIGLRVVLKGLRVNHLHDMANEKKKIFILGNGESLRENLKDDITLLQDNDVFSVNKFCLTDAFRVVKPAHYLLLDPIFYTENNLSDKFDQLRQDILSAFLNNTTWPIVLYIPMGTDMKEKWHHLSKQNQNITVKYINTGSFSGFRMVKYLLYKYNLAMPMAQNVLVTAIYVSLNLGYKHICLLGADHSWTQDVSVNDANQVCINDRHFYGDKSILFHKGDTGELWKMHEILSAWSRMFSGYFELSSYSRYLQAEIINCTPNSFIDAFPREQLDAKRNSL